MIEAMKQALEALENNRQTHHYCEDTWYSCPKHEEGCANDSEGDECNCGADKANIEIDAAITSLRQAIAELESQEPVAHCEAGPNYCWKCLEESKPTYGSEEIAKLREVNKSLVKNIEELKKEPPPFWPVVQHLLDEYGLQFIDVVAAYREATQPEQEPVQEPYKGLSEHMMQATKGRVRIDPVTGNTGIGTPPQRTWVGLTNEEVDSWNLPDHPTVFEFAQFIEAKLKQLNT